LVIACQDDRRAHDQKVAASTSLLTGVTDIFRAAIATTGEKTAEKKPPDDPAWDRVAPAAGASC
jgi:hypothetical protein